ncbi:hypothetical protein [Deinococcus alpinitundrae]|uniref:hypothetical protein n=1 Tax=Deinococcus alpinitundrae TaxID=468913 RepID=UPI00137B647D|nr:hypothetical protein [Deinococcus alpinitundrae]
MKAIVRTLQLPAPLFVSSVNRQPGVATLDVLVKVATWLRCQNYKLLLIDTGAEEYLPFPFGLEWLSDPFRVTPSLSLAARLI